MEEFRVYAGQYGATVEVSDDYAGVASTDRYGNRVAFVQSGKRWRPVEWFIVPEEAKDALISKAIAQYDASH